MKRRFYYSYTIVSQILNIFNIKKMVEKLGWYGFFFVTLQIV